VLLLWGAPAATSLELGVSGAVAALRRKVITFMALPLCFVASILVGTGGTGCLLEPLAIQVAEG